VERVWLRVREHVEAGRQAYIVCPRIGDGEDVEEPTEDGGATRSASVMATQAQLRADQLAGLSVGVLHGRLPADEKSRVMSDFAAGLLDVLISTTVIEVGVDVANASMMVIMDADRFGVSQLHQLRGRIGRGEHEGLCLMLTQMPEGHPALQRLQEVAKTRDGFALAEVDLRQRREGDVLGAAQSGRKSALKLLSLLRDEELIKLARTEAQQVIDVDPSLQNHPQLQEFLWDSFDSDRADFLHKA